MSETESTPPSPTAGVRRDGVRRDAEARDADARESGAAEPRARQAPTTEPRTNDRRGVLPAAQLATTASAEAKLLHARALAAFERGDFVEVRRLANELARTADDADTNRVVDELVGRVEFDRPSLYFMIGCALALLGIAWFYISHAHAS